MPTQFHEAQIHSICQDHGFITNGFMSFATEAMAKGIAENYVCDDDFGLPVYEAAIDSPDMSPTWEAIRGSESVSRLVSMLRMRLHKYFEGAVFYNETLEKIGVDGVDFATFSNVIRKEISVFPDAWKFDGNSILLCEVSDTSRVKWRKLSCIALIDDVLFHSIGMRISLCEIDARSGNKFYHPLNRVFELEHDGAGMLSHSGWDEMSNAEKLRAYYGEKEMFGDDYYCGYFDL